MLGSKLAFVATWGRACRAQIRVPMARVAMSLKGEQHRAQEIHNPCNPGLQTVQFLADSLPLKNAQKRIKSVCLSGWLAGWLAGSPSPFLDHAMYEWPLTENT